MFAVRTEVEEGDGNLSANVNMIGKVIFCGFLLEVLILILMEVWLIYRLNEGKEFE